jgi:protein involved in ribonucleotide reduction
MPQLRKSAGTYIADQKHSRIQNALYRSLIETHGTENVAMEENYIDVLVTTSEGVDLYEVKSASYASECVREAIGQLLTYAFRITDRKVKNIIVVGQYPLTQEELRFMKYIQSIISIPILYQYCPI